MMCSRCLITSDIEGFVLQENGCCNYCNDFIAVAQTYKKQWGKPEQGLEKRIKLIKESSKSAKYDCVIGVSGGLDSSYLVLKSIEWGLKPLLVHMDNGWNTSCAFENIQLFCDRFQLDLVTHVLDWEEFKHIQRAHLLASVPEIETPTDIAILHYLYKTANDYNIKHVLMGCNYITEGIFPRAWHYNPRDAVYTKAIVKKFAPMKIKQLHTLPLFKEMYYKLFKKIKTHYLLNTISYSREEAEKALFAIGWQFYGAKHHESAFTKIVQAYILPLKFNIDYRRTFLSVKICNGQLTQQQGLEEMAKLPYNEATLQEELDYICKKLGFTRQEFEAIMQAPPKKHHDYKNNEWFLSKVYRFYAFLFNKSVHDLR
jgi:N-acetyl sugar amidotransferase